MKIRERRFFAPEVGEGGGGAGVGEGGEGGNRGQQGGGDDIQAQIERAVEEKVKGLKQNNSSLIEEKRKLADRLKQFEDFDPEEYKNLRKEKEEREQKKLQDEGDFEKLKTQMIERHNEEKKKWSDREGSLLGAINENLVDSVLKSAIVKKGGSPELLLHILKPFGKIFEEDGRFIAKVVGPDGSPRIKNDSADPMTFEDLVEEIRQMPEYQRAFDASGNTGSGAGPSKSGSGGELGSSITREELNRLPSKKFREALDKQRAGELKVIG